MWQIQFGVSAKYKQRLVYTMSGKEILNCEKVLQFHLTKPLSSHSATAKKLNIIRSAVR